MMQEAEYSVPLERLAGIMRFQGLRKPQALPGGLTLYAFAKHRPIPMGRIKKLFQVLDEAGRD